jgi:hypothetical protein
VLALAVVVVTALAVPNTMQAVSCAPLEPGLPGFELLVRGKLVAIPEHGAVQLSVSRYFKGSGPVRLQAEVSGIGQGQRMDWSAEPRLGDEVVVAFRRDGAALRNTICNPFVILKPGEETPTWVTTQFGQGVSPEPLPAPPDQGGKTEGAGRPVLWLQLLGGAAVVGLIMLARREFRRRFPRR